MEGLQFHGLLALPSIPPTSQRTFNIPFGLSGISCHNDNGLSEISEPLISLLVNLSCYILHTRALWHGVGCLMYLGVMAEC